MKKLLTIILFCILTIGMASVASAAEWRLIGGSDGYTWFFDAQSLKKVNGTTYSVWMKLEYSEVSGREAANEFKLKTPVAYMLEKSEFNFQDKIVRAVDAIYYDKEGNVLNSNNAPTQWGSIFPNSLGETMFNDTYDHYKKYYQ